MNLAAQIETFENLQDLKALISGLKVKLSGAVSSQSDAVLKSELGGFYELVSEYLKMNKSDENDIDSALDAFLLELSKLEVLDLELAFRPHPAFIRKLLTWINDNVSANTILNISRNNKIIGGALITYKGKYGDFSSLRKLNNLFKQGGNLGI